MRLVIASNNPGKIREIRTIIALPAIEIVTPADLGQTFRVVEDGASFEDNARTKAWAAFRQFGLPVLADDSGLEIDALDGRPGVHSARFMGSGASYADQYGEVLRLLADIPAEKRFARFRCCAVLVETSQATHTFQGICEGTIAFEARGMGGFGYDPIFVPEGHSATFAELPVEVKNQISHRARAFRQVREYLARLGAH